MRAPTTKGGSGIAVVLLDELRKLQAIISALAAAPSEEAIADVVVDRLLPAVGADAGVLALNDERRRPGRAAGGRATATWPPVASDPARRRACP